MKSTILTFGLILSTLIAFAQPRHFHHAKGKMKAENPELHQALQQHFKTTVYPVMKEKKAEFDKSLSRKQRKALNKLRKKNETLRTKSKDLHTKMKAEHAAGKDKTELKETYGSELQKQRIERMNLNDEVLLWIANNETNVHAVMKTLKPLHKEWRTEKKAIVEQHRPDDGQKTDENKKHKHHHKGKKHHGKHHGKHYDKKGKHGMQASREDMAAIKFVLWNGELPEEKTETITKKTVETVPQQTIELTVFPNPAKEMTTVKYELSTDAKSVNLILTNLNGQVVKNLTYNNLSKGEQAVQIDISNLEKGQYFYTIIADGVKKTEKIIVE